MDHTVDGDEDSWKSADSWACARPGLFINFSPFAFKYKKLFVTNSVDNYEALDALEYQNELDFQKEHCVEIVLFRKISVFTATTAFEV